MSHMMNPGSGGGGGVTFGPPTGNIDIGDAQVEGVSANATRADHQHVFTAPGAGYPVDVDAAAEADGTATTPARSDHKHTITTAAPTVVLGTAGAVGAAASVVRTDATIPAFDTTAPTASAVGDSAAVGSVAFAARRDHVHGREGFVVPAILLASAAVAGVATSLIRSDATLAAFDTTVPTTSIPNDAAAVGSAAFAARRDHTHGRTYEVFIRKSADETVNNSTTLQNDDDLTFSVAANTTWVGFIAVFYNSGTTPDFKFAINGPAGATLLQAALGLDTAAAGVFGDVRTGATSGLGTGVARGGAAGAAGMLVMFSLAIAGTAGTLDFQWAQNTATVSDTTVLAGSFLAAWRVA